MKRTSSMMGIESPTGSHLPVLESVSRAAGDGLIIEHGAGLYSTPLLARIGARVLCTESHVGWAEWARWIYEGRAEIVDSWKQAAARLEEAALVFIDGTANERGTLVQMCLDRGVPSIIAHDTNDSDWSHYGYQPHMFAHPRYNVTHHSEDTHRTTLWVLRS